MRADIAFGRTSPLANHPHYNCADNRDRRAHSGSKLPGRNAHRWPVCGWYSTLSTQRRYRALSSTAAIARLAELGGRRAMRKPFSAWALRSP